MQKAAILLVLLGEETATAVYKHLNESELQRITEQIAMLERWRPGVADQFLREYHRLYLTQESLAAGGPEVAEKMLSKAFGDEAAKVLLQQVMLAREETGRNFDALQKADPQQLVKFVQGEHPQTIAMVLAHLGSKAAASLLVLLPDKLRGKTIKRLAEMQQFSPRWRRKFRWCCTARCSAGRTGPAFLWRREIGGGAAESNRAGGEQGDSGNRGIRGCAAGAEHSQPHVHIRGFAGRAGNREYANLLSSVDKKIAGHVVERRAGGFEESHFQNNVVARGGNAEGRHGSAGPGAQRRR